MSFGEKQGFFPPPVGQINSKEELWEALKKRWAWERKMKERSVLDYECARGARICRRLNRKVSQL